MRLLATRHRPLQNRLPSPSATAQPFSPPPHYERESRAPGAQVRDRRSAARQLRFAVRASFLKPSLPSIEIHLWRPPPCCAHLKHHLQQTAENHARHSLCEHACPIG